MIGDAVPIRFSKRIGRKASLSPNKVLVKKKTRRLAVKKRTSLVNSSVFTAKRKTKIERTEKTRLGRKSKLKKSSKEILGVQKAKENIKAAQKSKTKRNSKQTSNLSKEKSLLLESVGPGKSKNIAKTCGQKRETRSSLNASQINLSDQRKIVLTKKNDAEVKVHKKHFNCRSLRASKSSLSSNKTPIAKKLKKGKLIKSKAKSPHQMKSASEVTSLGSESIKMTPNIRKSTRMSGDLEGKISARLSTESLNEDIYLQRAPSKPNLIAKNPEKITRPGKRKPRRPSKGQNHSKIVQSEISLCTSSFHSILETPQPERHSDKRKSSRFSKPSPLRTLNKELSLSTPVSFLRKKPDSMVRKTSKSCKSSKLSKTQGLSKKQLKHRKLPVKKGSTDSYKKLKRDRIRQINTNIKHSEKNFKIPLSNETENLPVNILSTPAFPPMHARSLSRKFLCKADSKSTKRKMQASPTDASEEIQARKKRKITDFSSIPTKGTLKHKRWLLNNLKDNNTGYEDDIFEDQNFNLYNSAFHFGDESDGSSVNIATPKFDCILTPALPKKTPPFKDCISTTELMEARKTAEEYLYRRNKKRKSGDKPSSSGKKTSTNKKNTTQDLPEKKKLDFEEAVNKLIAVQKDLEKEAENGDEEDDSYFSDASD